MEWATSVATFLRLSKVAVKNAKRGESQAFEENKNVCYRTGTSEVPVAFNATLSVFNTGLSVFNTRLSVFTCG